MTVAFIALLSLAGVLTFAGAWIAAGAVALVAFVLAVRYEIRWVLDHTKLTKHAPRPVPPPRHLW